MHVLDFHVLAVDDGFRGWWKGSLERRFVRLDCSVFAARCFREDLAAPDDEVLSLLEALALSPGIQVDIVSGRPRQALEEWFGDVPVALWAEHGLWYRARRSEDWQPASLIVPDWLMRIRPILEQFTAHTPGSHVERKSASIAWHYRRAQRDFGARQAHELRMLLGDALSNQPCEVLEGKKVRSRHSLLVAWSAPRWMDGARDRRCPVYRCRLEACSRPRLCVWCQRRVAVGA